MAEHRHRKKTKSHYCPGDVNDVEGTVNRAMKQVAEAMKQVKMAEKQAVEVHKDAKRQARQARHAANGTSTGDTFSMPNFVQSEDNPKRNITIDHNDGPQVNTFIHIGSADNIQVGCQNTMYIHKDARPRRRESYKESQANDNSFDMMGDGGDWRQETGVKADNALSDAVLHVLSCDRLVTNEDMKLVCNDVGSNWRRFLRCLDLDDATIEQSHQNFKDEGIRQVLFEGMKVWHRRDPKAATLAALAQVLQKISRIDIIEKLAP